MGLEHSDVLFTMHNLADVYLREGKYLPGAKLNDELRPIQRRVLGAEHPLTLMSLYQRGTFHRVLGQYEQADAIFVRVFDARRRLLGERHPETVRVIAGRGVNLMLQRKYEEAEALFQKSADLWRASVGDHPDTAAALAWLGETRLALRRYREAETVLREALRLQEKTNPTFWQRYNFESLLGASLSGQTRFAEAEPLLLSGYNGMAEREDRIPAYNKDYLTRAGDAIVRLYQASGRSDRAAEWKATLLKTRP